MLRGQVLSSSGGGILKFWNVARSMKRFAFVKLLGKGSAVTSSCLAFEFHGRYLSARTNVWLKVCLAEWASVVIEWWWHLHVLEYRPAHEEICFCQAAWQG